MSDVPQRTAQDKVIDPQTGDILVIDPSWTREVIKRDGDSVRFIADFYGTKMGPFDRTLESWSAGLEDVVK